MKIKDIELANISRYRGELMGAAMLFIILFHVALPRENAFFGLRRMGNVGVDMFLFLSGIGLWFSWMKNPSAKHFFIRRYLRIYPAWLIIACLYYIPRFRGGDLEAWINLIGEITINWNFWRYDELTFWYIPATMMLYLFAPAYMELIKRHPIYKWLPVVMIMWCILVQYVTPIHQAVGHLEIFWSRVPIFFIGINMGEMVRQKQTLDGASIWMIWLMFLMTLLASIFLEQEKHGMFPLFPEVFRKAGYNVTFITNEFLPQAKEAVYDFSGGFFLNNPELSKLQFDHRNTQLHDLDDGLLKDYDDSLKNFQKEHNLTIFHLMGQHVNYKQRYRTKQARFWASSYEDKRPELTNAQRKMLSHYDNATLYNDSIVAQIVKRFQKQDAIVIYVPDHGEECYEENRGFICRNHSAEIDWPLAHYEFEIPFWIYCSPKYIRNHRDIYRQIRKAKDKRFMTDALPHLLLYLADIETPTYKEEYNILSPKYDEMRPRILKNSADYDKLRDAHLEKIKKEESKKVKKKERRN